MSSPLDSIFSTSLTAAPRGNLGCALSDSLQFFMNKENWKSKFKLKSEAITKQREVKKSVKVQQFKVQILSAEIDRSKFCQKSVKT